MKTNSIIALITGLLVMSCNNDVLNTGRIELATKQFALAPFTTISHNTSFPVYITRGTCESAELTGSASLLEDVELHVEDQTLFIRFKEGHSIASSDLWIKVQLPELKELKINGSGDAFLSSDYNIPSLLIHGNSMGKTTNRSPFYVTNPL